MSTYRTGNAIYTKSNAVKITFFAAGAFVIGVGIAFIAANKNFITPPQTFPASSTSEDQRIVHEKRFVFAIPDQPAEKWVVIENISVSEDVWLAIYEESGGQPGNILGAARFRPEHVSGRVELLRNMLPERTYYAIVHIDDGDIEFDFKRDIVYESAPGERLVYHFTTTN